MKQNNTPDLKNILEDIFCTPLGELFERDRQRLAAEEEEEKK